MWLPHAENEKRALYYYTSVSNHERKGKICQNRFRDIRRGGTGSGERESFSDTHTHARIWKGARMGVMLPIMREETPRMCQKREEVEKAK